MILLMTSWIDSRLMVCKGRIAFFPTDQPTNCSRDKIQSQTIWRRAASHTDMRFTISQCSSSSVIQSASEPSYQTMASSAWQSSARSWVLSQAFRALSMMMQKCKLAPDKVWSPLVIPDTNVNSMASARQCFGTHWHHFCMRLEWHWLRCRKWVLSCILYRLFSFLFGLSLLLAYLVLILFFNLSSGFIDKFLNLFKLLSLFYY